VFPSAAVLAELTPADLPMPASRARSLIALCTALANGDVVLDAGTDPSDALVALEEIPGIGPWTAGYIALRATGAPDVFLSGDLGVRRAAARLGLPEAPRALAERASRWRPWRSYAVLHLWQSEH
jgi:AraC family transcriptional regulator, regulatory protein of adaptative response / DNA-3-methyladenine glycosylase II